MAPTNTPARETFDEIVFSRSIAFIQQLLEDVPELDGLAVIPSFKKPNLGLPWGAAGGQLGALQTSEELMHMLGQMMRGMQDMVQRVHGYLQNVDNNIRSRYQHLQELHKKIQESTRNEQPEARTENPVSER